MNAVAVRLRAGDVVEMEMDGVLVSALILLATDDTVILDACDGRTPLVARPEDLIDVRVYDGVAA